MSTPASDTQFGFDPKLYRDWIAGKGDPEDYRRFGGLSERDAAAAIDELFADAREAGAVTPPAKNPGLDVDVRASRASVLILLSDRASGHPSVASNPIEVREVVDRDGGGADEALEIVRFLVYHANALLKEASECLLRASERLSADLCVVAFRRDAYGLAVETLERFVRKGPRSGVTVQVVPVEGKPFDAELVDLVIGDRDREWKARVAPRDGDSDRGDRSRMLTLDIYDELDRLELK